jgi:hypothetical protein
MKSEVRKRSMSVALIVAGILVLVVPVAAGIDEDTPIPPGPSTELPDYIGAPAKPHPLPPPHVPQNPSMAANPWNNVHNDTWLSDVYMVPGPLGREPAILSSRLEAARRSSTSPMFTCGCLTFDSRGRIVATCVGPGELSLVLLDPLSLEVLAFLHLPINPDPAAAYGSAYMYLDDRDRAVVNLTDHLWVVGQTGPADSPAFDDPIDYDLSMWLDGDSMQAVMPDWQGRLWFTTRHSATVGVLDPEKYPAEGAVNTLKFDGEEIGNSPAVTADSTYVVTTKKLYRLAAGPDGVPQVVWQSEPYQNSGIQKPGQLTAGSGTSPTILDGGKYVAITDNDDQMHVVVYRTEEKLRPHEERVVCEVPVFEPGAGATEDSLIGLGRSLIVANQYGYSIEFNEEENRFESTPTEPGVARVDIDDNGKDCRLVWTNETLAVPQVGPKMSTKNGLMYLFTRTYDQSGLDVYYWTGVDFRTGERVWAQQVGTGPLFDSYVPGPAIGPTGALYVGTYGGFVAMRDSH